MRARHRRATALALVLLASLVLATGAAHALPNDGSTLAGDRGRVSPGGGAAESLQPDLFQGAATYAVPIVLPPGTGGLLPDLALRYSSAARSDSWVGNGWSLGLSSIARSLVRGTPTYDDARDRFELDGEPLVRDPVVPGRFSTRRERFARIVHEADGTWTLTRKDGVRLRFGTRPDARVDDAAGRTFQWLQTELEDLHGNVVRAAYDRRDAGTAYLSELRYTLRRGAGGSLSSLDGDPARDRVVRFSLGVRPDAPTSRLAGFPRTLAHRLERIEALAGGELVRRYELRYAQSPDSGRSLLAALALYGTDAAAAAPTPPQVTSFRYRANAGVPGREGFALDPSFAWPAGLALVESDRRDGGVRLADVNGDGLPDLVKAMGVMAASGGNVALTADSGVYLNTGTGFAPTPSPVYPLPVFTGVTGNTLPLSVAWRFPDGTVWGNGMTPVDVTGDGRADFVGAIGFVPSADPGYSGSLAQSYQGRWCRATATGFECLPFASMYQDGAAYTGKQGIVFDAPALTYRFTFLGGNVQLADLTGDGLPDLVVRGRDRQVGPQGSCRHDSMYSYVSVNQGGLAFARAPLSSTPIPHPGCAAGTQAVSASFQPCDVAQDASCPLRLFHNTTQYADLFSNGIWTFQGHQELGNLELDLDGDGLADFAAATRHLGAEVRSAALNDGRGGYVAAPEWRLPVAFADVAAAPTADAFSEGRSTDLGARIADVNGDGRLDVVTGREGAATPSEVWLGDGDANEATAPTPWVAQPGSPWALPAGLAFATASGQDLGVRLVDVDGDGMVDVVRSFGAVREVYRSRGAVPDLLTGVTTPFGGGVSIEYAPSTRFANAGDDGAPDLPHVLQLVTAIETADGVSIPARVTMSYEGGLFDPEERELRGFRRVTTTLADGRRTVTTFHQDAARAGLAESTLRLDAAGVAWEELHREYTADADGVAPWTPLVSAVTRVERGPGAVPRFTRSEIRYDGGGPLVAGNATAILERGAVSPGGADLDPSDDRVTELVYARANAALHLVDRVKRRRVLQGTGAGALLLRETELFYDGDGSGAGTPTRGLVTLQRDLLLEPGQPDAETRFTFDVYGNLVARVDPRANAGQGGGTTRFEWDARFHTFESASVNALGHRTERSYTADASCPVAYPAGAGLVQVERGPNDLATGSRGIRCHDVFGRVARERAPLGASETIWTYVDTPGAASALRAERATAAGGLRTRRSLLDGLGREVRTEASGPQGRSVVADRSFDAFGRVASETAPRFAGEPAQTTVFGYDPLDRASLVRLPGGRVATTEHAPGRTTLVDPTGRAVVRRSDAFDRVIEVEEAEGAARYVTRYAWAATGELLRVTDARGNATQIVWDRLGRRRLLVDPDAGATAYTLDAAGNVVRQDGPLGRVEWAWDALDRPTQRRVGSVLDATWTWDTALRGIGRLARRTDAAGVFEVSVYHPSGRPFSEAHTRGGVSLRFVTSYDPLGQLESRTYPSERTVEWLHDSAGYVTQVREAEGSYATAIEWDARGRLARWTAGNGLASRAAFDPGSGRLDTLELRGPGGAALERLRYGFDAADRVISIADLDAPARSRSFSYDALGRLERATGPFGADLAPATLRSAYDPLGNLTCKDATGPAGCSGGRTFVYPAAGAPRPHAPTQVDGVTASYTAAGGLSVLGARRYLYDGLGRLSGIFEGDDWIATQRYDADGRRARVVAAELRRTTTLELVSDDFDWDRTRGLAHVHVFLGGAPIATQTDRLLAPAAGAAAPLVRDGDAAERALAAASAAAALVLCAQLARLRRRGAPIARPAVAGGTAFAFVLLVALPLYASPDGDLDGSGVLDAADALRAWEIARGARTATSAELAHGDVAPLEAAPESPSRVNGGDVALLLRALAGDDVDGDGLSLDDESAHGASPFRADSDRDGLSDPEEIAAGTDPANADSDGDGLADGAEAAVGSDPLAADTDGDGLADAGDPEPVSGVVHRHVDAIGSALWMTGEGGVVLARMLYRPWGESLAGTPGGDASPPVFGFTGQRALPSTGLYDYGARFYDPSLGRFLQPDPRIPDPSDPQSLNRYAYARNDPLRRTDPTGESSFFAALFGAVASALSGVAGPENAEGLSNLGIALGAFARGGLDAGATVTSDGRVSLELAGILVPPSFDGWTRRSPPRDLSRMTVADLRFGDVLLTRDGGTASGIAAVRGMEGYGHGAFVLGVEGPFLTVASSDNRGRYTAENDDPSVGGRVWDVFRTGETIHRDPVEARVEYYRRTGGLNGGLSQYGADAGANVCTSFTAELYRQGGGSRLPQDPYGSFVTPGELALGLGPPVGRVAVPQLTILRRKP